tara:strand:+ start:447 stop:2615 length:2169 start_codon:yes stop_codon:yes gene_type:complete
MAFVFKITTTTANQSFTIPCASGTFNATVNYGDGTNTLTVTTYNDANLTHSFTSAGQYTITIDGVFTNVSFFDNADSRVLVDEVVDLGDVGWLSLANAFRECTNLTSFTNGTGDTSNVDNMFALFASCQNLVNVDLNGFSTASANNILFMFAGCSSLITIDISGFDLSATTSFSALFSACTSLQTVILTGLDTSNIQNFDGLFRECYSLVNLDVSGFDTSKATITRAMFKNCQSLTALDVTNFDTSNVTNIQEMFSNCISLTALDVTNFDTSNVATMFSMFSNCNSLTALDVTNFDTSNVNSMSQMFISCSSLTSLDVRNFNTEKVVSLRQAFNNCNSLTSLQLGAFNNLVATDMFRTFFQCESLVTLDLSGFITPQAVNMQQMFAQSESLTNLQISHFDISKVVNGDNFLFGANNALTQASYKKLLEAWARQDVQQNVNWHFGNAQYVVEDIEGWSPMNNSLLESFAVVNKQLIFTNDGSATYGLLGTPFNTTAGSVYLITADVIALSGSMRILITADNANKVIASTGKFYWFYTASSTTTDSFFGPSARNDPNASITIDNISVKEILAIPYITYNNIAETKDVRDTYTLFEGEYIGTELADWSDSGQATEGEWIWDGVSVLSKENTYSASYDFGVALEVGLQYELTYTKFDHTAGSPSFGVNGTTTTFEEGSKQILLGEPTGTYNLYLTPTSSGSLTLSGGSFVGSISNVSVRRIIEVAQ